MVVAAVTNHQSEQNVLSPHCKMETFFGERYFFDKFHGMVNRIALTHALTLTPNTQIKPPPDHSNGINIECLYATFSFTLSR